VEQVYEEEAKDEEATEGEDEEDQIEVEEKEQQVPPKTPRKNTEESSVRSDYREQRCKS
jgi:hypothetical protein